MNPVKNMEGMADFFYSLTGNIELLFFSMAIGSLFWIFFTLQPWELKNNEILPAQISVADSLLEMLARIKTTCSNHKMAGFFSVFTLFQIGMIFMFYREPLV
jgi:hypothetical protein